APYAVWQGTSADAFFSGVIATGIAMLVVAMTTTQRSVEIVSGLGGGVLLGAACFLTFGVPTLAPLVFAIAWRTRRIRWIVPAVVGAGAVVVAFALHHYWWFTGLQHTRMFYAAGTAKFRPAFYFFFANLAVLAIALGPAAIAGLSRLRRNPLAVIVVGALACVLCADASGLSKAETERIWLIYMPWIVVAAGALATTVWRQRVWLGAQAAGAVLVQVMLVSKW
ncbi:MAG: putative conserved integral rane protein, partial [Ilumatobacteraceae bacterium]|nr:putative conserved integral rane protein [Ilumatobacteraceae bacterium]